MLTTEELEAWRANPVTVRLLGNLRDLAEMQKDQICKSFWLGSEVSPKERALVDQAFLVLADLEESSAEDIERTEEMIDEWKRFQARELQRIGAARRG